MDHGWSSLRIILVAERAIAEPEVERSAHDDDQVGLPEGGRPGPGDQQLMTARQDAAALPVGDDRQPEFLGRGPGGLLGAAHPHVRAEHQHRAAGRREQSRDGGGRPGIARHAGRAGPGGPHPCAARPEVFGQPGVSRAVEGLQGRVHEHRAAVRLGGQPERLVHPGADLRGVVLGPGLLGDGPEQPGMVELLQAAGAPPRVGGPAAEDDHRRAVEVGRGDGADAVGHPGPRGQHGQPREPGQPGGGLRGEHGGLLVPHVQQPHRRVRVHRRVVEREHVPAGQREHGLHAVRPGRRHGQPAPVLAGACWCPAVLVPGPRLAPRAAGPPLPSVMR